MGEKKMMRLKEETEEVTKLVSETLEDKERRMKRRTAVAKDRYPKRRWANFRL